MALKNARPGQTIKLADGTYAGAFAATRDGTRAEPITLTGSSRAILTSTGYGFHLKASNWQLNGFTIAGATKGLVLEGATHSVVTNLTIRRTDSQGVLVRANSSANTLSRNRISDTGRVDPNSGAAVTIGTYASGWAEYGGPDRSDANTLSDNVLGPDNRGGAVTIFEGSTGGRLVGNTFNGAGMLEADTWVLIRGNGYQITQNSGTSAPIDGYQVRAGPGGWAVGRCLGQTRPMCAPAASRFV